MTQVYAVNTDTCVSKYGDTWKTQGTVGTALGPAHVLVPSL